MNEPGKTVGIVDGAHDANGVTFTIDWLAQGADIRFRIASDVDGVALMFGPAQAVADWPAWLRAMAAFGPDGGEVTIRLDPLRGNAPDFGVWNARDIRGSRARGAFASLTHALADALRRQCPDPSAHEAQAIETCAGQALAQVDGPGILPTQALLPGLFLPSPLPILIDDVNPDPVRRHVRLTYRLPRLHGYWTDGCSLRLFHGEREFGVEFRALPDDHLPVSLQPACIRDDLGPLLRLTVDRRSRNIEFVGDGGAETALRLVRAIVRQVSRDFALKDSLSRIEGLEAEPWRYWLAALPDLLAPNSEKPLGMHEA